MNKRPLKHLAALLLACVILVCPAGTAAAETSVSLTVAVGGAVGGVCWFFLVSFGSRFAPGGWGFEEAALTYGPAGFRAGPPRLRLASAPVTGEPALAAELLRLEF